MFEEGQACSQSILVRYSDKYGLDAKIAMKLAAGFAGGMQMSETCGAVTGSYMVLGLHASGKDCHLAEGREKTYSMIKDFTARFKAKNGSVSCKELLGCDISTENGLAEAKHNDLFNTKCVELVRSASEILEILIEEDK